MHHYCPHCGEPVEYDREDWAYCEDCDWHEYEDEGDAYDEAINPTWGEDDDDDC